MNTTAITVTLDIDALYATPIEPDDPCLCIHVEHYAWDETGRNELRKVEPGDVVWCSPQSQPGASVFQGAMDKRFHTDTTPSTGLLYKRHFLPLQRVTPASATALRPGDLMVLNQRASSTEPGPNLVGVLENVHIDGGWVRLDLRPTDNANGVLVATTAPTQEFWLDSEFSITHVWRVRRDPSVYAEPEAEPVAEPEAVVEVPDVESIRAENQALKQTVGELQARVDVLSSDLAQSRSHHQTDIDTIGSALLHEAERRDWCSDYDDVVARLNQELHRPLEVRTREYDVTFDVTGRTTVPVSDKGVSGTVEVSWEARVTVYSMEAVGDPSSYDFADDVDEDSLLDDIEYHMVSNMDVEGDLDIHDPEELWGWVKAEASSYDIQVEVYDYSTS